MKFTTISLVASLITDAANSQVFATTKGHLRAEHAADNANRDLESNIKPSSNSVSTISEVDFALATPESSSKRKSGKAGKSSKKQCETTSQEFVDELEFPSGDRLAILEERYGKLISDQKKLDDVFCVKYNARVATSGANFLVGENARVDRFEGHDHPLTGDEFKTVCATRCANNPSCDFVSFREFFDITKERVVAQDYFLDGFDWSCDMYSLDFGVSFVQEDLVLPDKFPSGLLLKHGVEIPNFSEASCDIPGQAYLRDAATCAFAPKPPEACIDLVTDDFKQYVMPAIECLAVSNTTDPLGVVEGCLGCIRGKTGQCVGSAANVCTDNLGLNIIADKCGKKCLNNTCLSEIKQATLCALGSPYDVGYANGTYSFGGCVNSAYDDVTPAFTCPSLD